MPKSSDKYRDTMSPSPLGNMSFKVGVNWEKMIILTIIACKCVLPFSQMPDVVQVLCIWNVF